ncbi:RNA recognition motif domain [Cinara cedri]|uniref:RNA recognition motif domain n=1 Tax=Cinara cedri TaxID=506608 RepID=A0A5E4MDA1_9HEMI|nr:RNA recognition motif domain [Cinara cedri]
MSDYGSKSADQLSMYYDPASVFIESSGDGRWTEPAAGVQNIVGRLAELNLTGDEWPMETCQRTQTGGMLAVLVSVNDGTRQILVVDQVTGGGGGDPSPRTVVFNHFYSAAGDGGAAVDDADYVASFPKRFANWAAELDSAALKRYRTSFRIGMAITRNYYASPAKRPVDSRSRLRQYDAKARFTCSKNGNGGSCVHVGPQSIQRKYGRLSLDYKRVKLQSIETCSSTVPTDDRKRWSFVLTVGTAPQLMTSPGCGSDVHKFVQFFVIDDRKRKILNDVLCFGFPVVKSATTRSSSEVYSSSPSTSRSRTTTASGSSLSRTPSLLSLSSSSFGGHKLSSSSSSSSMTSGSYLCSSTTDDLCSAWEDTSTQTSDQRIALRTRLVAQTLMGKTRSAATTQNTGEQKPCVTPAKLNPRQLFIGCVPLHVKYGQLKSLFEQFGEVTYVKVYEGFNKQTGAKMLHNYAFLFFKDETSVERAIAASPIPLDANWNLNVSRPHQHYTLRG